VIHAGIYYPPGTLKALHCVRGRELLYAYCAERGIGHRRCGKLIVATAPEQVPKLAVLKDTAARNGVADLEFLSSSQACGLEPQLRCVAALASPSSGIVDSHALMLAYQGDLEGGRRPLRLQHPDRACKLFGRRGDRAHHRKGGGPEPAGASPGQLRGAARPAAGASDGRFPAHHVPPTYYAKGTTFRLPDALPSAG
jgi:hypothetical protein